MEPTLGEHEVVSRDDGGVSLTELNDTVLKLGLKVVHAFPYEAFVGEARPISVPKRLVMRLSFSLRAVTATPPVIEVGRATIRSAAVAT